MKTVLITGITGLIGKHLMYKVLAEGEMKVIGQYFSTRNIDEYIQKGVEMRQANICEPQDIKDLTKGCDLVVHSAARVVDFGTKEEFYLAHYDATKWMLEDSVRHGVQQFIYISSFGPATYIDRTHSIPDETVPLIKSGVHYDDAKRDTEILVKDFCEKNQIKYTIIRPSAVIGPDSVWVKEPLKRAETKLGVKLIDQGRHDACLIDVDNLSDGIYETIINPIANGQTYFFMDDYGISWKKYLTDLLAMKGHRPKGNMPKSLALMMAKIFEKVFPLFNRIPPIGVKSVMATGSDRRVDTSKARRELHWQSKVTYEQSMEKIRKSLE